jgi:hypothetical protein
MKMIIAFGLLVASVTVSAAQFGGSSYSNGLSGTGSNPSSHYVQPHTTSSGSYVSGHYQTNSNNTQMDNYGTRGNVNPYTGAVGTRTPRY